MAESGGRFQGGYQEVPDWSLADLTGFSWGVAAPVPRRLERRSGSGPGLPLAMVGSLGGLTVSQGAKGMGGDRRPD